jgi:hypothetical protein
MRAIEWRPEKNRELKSDAKRRICFEDIVAAIESGGLLDDIEHPNREKYPGQRMLVVLANGSISRRPLCSDAGRDIPEDGLRESAAESALSCRVDPMKNTPEVSRYLDAEEKALIEAFEGPTPRSKAD